MCREPCEQWVPLWLRGFSCRLVRSSVAWLAWSRGWVDTTGGGGAGRRRRPKSRCVALRCYVLCSVLAVPCREEDRRLRLGLSWPLLPCLPCSFPAPSFSASLTLRAPLPYIGLHPSHPPFSFLSVSFWNQTTRPDRRGRSLTTASTFAHHHAFSPLFASTSSPSLLGPCQAERVLANHCRCIFQLSAPPGFVTALGLSRPLAVVLVPLPTKHQPPSYSTATLLQLPFSIQHRILSLTRGTEFAAADDHSIAAKRT